jgi:hypothetical protein
MHAGWVRCDLSVLFEEHALMCFAMCLDSNCVLNLKG